MKLLALTGMLALSAADPAPPTSKPADPISAPAFKLARVRGKALVTGNYCGGAAPPMELVRKLHEPKPAPFELLVRHGDTNSDSEILATIKADPKTGAFEVALRPGTYCVLRPDKRAYPGKPGDSRFVDASCFKKYTESCDAVWRVTEGGIDGSIVLDQPCFGACYRGPLPP